jgi:sigma-B regulation protein RsbU (phosphoserine phosphatase)
MARLVAILDESRRAFELEDRPMVVGRSETCDVRLASPEVSRQHCRLVPVGGGAWELHDMGSQNGTRVNGRRIAKHPLTDGDRIEFGKLIVLFETSAHQGLEDALVTQPLEATASLSKSILGASPQAGLDWRTEREQLLRLADVAMQLTQVDDVALLLDRIMDSAVALAGAQRGFLILIDSGQFKVKAACNIRAEHLDRQEYAASRSVVKQVARSGASVLLADAGNQGDFTDARSIMDMGLQSVLAVPLTVQGRTIGALYLDHADRANAFGPADERLLRLFGSQAALAVERARLRAEASTRARLSHELEVAGRIQRRLLPATPPKLSGAVIHGVTVPATDMSGDAFDFLPQEPGQTSFDFIVTDVAGKGVGAGVVMVMARAILRSIAGHARGPRAAMAELHRIIRPDIEARMFLSCTMARWEPKRGALWVAGAGQGPFLIYRARSKKVEEAPTGGIVLGAPKPDISDLITEREWKLATGDLALFFSDGATEARGVGDAEYGKDRLIQALARHGNKSPADCIAALQEEIGRFVGDRPPHDDLTLVALRRG